jgi:hypothetical protein
VKLVQGLRRVGLIEAKPTMPTERVGPCEDVGDRVDIDMAGLSKVAFAVRAEDRLKLADDAGDLPARERLGALLDSDLGVTTRAEGWRGRSRGSRFPLFGRPRRART